MERDSLVMPGAGGKFGIRRKFDENCPCLMMNIELVLASHCHAVLLDFHVISS